MNVIPLVNKPYVNEVNLNEQNLYQKILQLVTLQPVDPQRPAVPFWKDLNLLKIQSFNSEKKGRFLVHYSRDKKIQTPIT